MLKIIALLLLTLSTTLTHAHEVIVRLKSDQPLKMPGFVELEPLFPALNIYLLKSTGNISQDAALKKANSHPQVESAMLNEPVQMRQEPNDPSFPEQYGLKLIEASGAWAIGTGGRNSHRDDVVVAVVDSGLDVGHEDLVDNIWVNAGEIPGNGIDDDNNGYIDDVNGWDSYTNSGTLPKSAHGTHVAGIIGARGNNAKHISGVSWGVKVMGVRASSGQTSVVVKGYSYIYEQKKRWLESKARIGANVVATNSSFGVDRADCTSERYRLWNEIYDEMGKLGILSAVATANQAWDIDTTGDVPSGCLSEYIISVTNTDEKDKLYTRAGWGKKTVDLSAPGTKVLSTVPGNKLSQMTGTSMATPHVAGSIGLLASLASNSYTVLSKEDPGGAALALKNILLQTVDPLPELAEKTVSGGRLNVSKAAEIISRH